MGKKALCSKICLVALLILINILAVLLSLFLIIAGIILTVIFTSNGVVIQSVVSLISVVIALGVLFLLISILGLISSISSIPSRKSFQIFSTVSVVIYMVVLLVLISVQVGAVIAGIILKDQIATQDTLAEFFDGFVRLYDNPAIQTIIDGWQSGFMCCGYNGSSSWFINGSNFTRPNLPDSCCSRNTTQQCTVSNAFDQGCSPVLLAIVTNYIGAVIGVFVAITVFQIAILAINLTLICCIWLDKTAGDYNFKKTGDFVMGSSYP